MHTHIYIFYSNIDKGADEKFRVSSTLAVTALTLGHVTQGHVLLDQAKYSILINLIWWHKSYCFIQGLYSSNAVEQHDGCFERIFRVVRMFDDGV